MISIDPKSKRRGRPAKGTDPIVGIRMSPALRTQIEAWAFRQKDSPTLSAAIRQLVEKALTGGAAPVTISVRPRAKKDSAPPPILAGLTEANVRTPLRSDRWRVRRPRRTRGHREFSSGS